MDVSVIIPVWNQSKLTDAFFRQNVRYANRDDIEFVVMDNNSTDNTLQVLDKWQGFFRRMRIAPLTENFGFGGGNNIGAALATGDIFIFTQNDVVVSGDYIQHTINAIEESGGDAALFGTTLISEGDDWNTFGRTVIRYLQGWYLASTKETWRKIGGFDERYFPCDYEDMDLSYAAEKLGVELREIDLPLAHAFGGTTRQLDRLTITRMNQVKFKEKWGF